MRNQLLKLGISGTLIFMLTACEGITPMMFFGKTAEVQDKVPLSMMEDVKVEKELVSLPEYKGDGDLSQKVADMYVKVDNALTKIPGGNQ